MKDVQAAVDRLKAVQEELTREDYLHEQEIAAFDTVLTALQSANERADRAEAAMARTCEWVVGDPTDNGSWTGCDYAENRRRDFCPNCGGRVVVKEAK